MSGGWEKWATFAWIRAKVGGGGGVVEFETGETTEVDLGDDLGFALIEMKLRC